MHTDHGHHHADPRHTDRRRLTMTLALVLLYTGAEVVGGVLSGSLALLADAGHMVSDAASLGLALFAMWIAQRPRTPGHTYGFHRAEILAALANGVTLVVIAVFIVREAWQRLQSPPEVAGPLMMAVAIGGLLVNLAGLGLLHGGRGHSLNLRGAWLHVLTDALGSVQAIAAGALIWAFGWHWADPVASVLIAALVVWSAWSLLRESVDVLLEATPRHLDVEEIRAALQAVPGVDDVHHLHVWTITSGFVAMSAHVVPKDAAPPNLLWQLQRLLATRFGIEHATLQIEPRGSTRELPTVGDETVGRRVESP
jgi:cobalt-zinc-cadmium efflux system protein